MSSYPYSLNVIVATESTRIRPDTQTIMKCTLTGNFHMQHTSGRIYPLEDRKDPNSDAVLRVID